jgi:hypothetical protein
MISLCKPYHPPTPEALAIGLSSLAARNVGNSFELYWYLKEHPQDPRPDGLMEAIAPQKTWLNRIGELASYGTDCVCCLGWRIIVSGIIGIGVGKWLL